MVGKQVIIDGCDVAGCEYLGLYKECKLKCGSCYPVDCSDNPNCHYKLYKRKEQELGKVCKAFDIEYSIDEETGNLFGRCNKLYKKEQECERLRFPMKDSNYAILTKEEFEDYKKLKQILAEIAEPYKMTIKKICGNCKKYDDCHACCYKDINCYKYTSTETNACEKFTYLDEFVPNILANNILQKISEVIK